MRTDGYITFNNRKYRIISKARFCAFLTVLVIAAIIMGSWIIGIPSASAENNNNVTKYTVEQGDTVWKVASKYTDNDQDVRETVYKIRKANGLKDASLTVGQTIDVPVAG